MKPILVVNPATDDVFADFARLILEDGAARIIDLERRLRSVYPDAVVHARDLAGEPFQIWYVYRDGQWVDDRRTLHTVPGGHFYDDRSQRAASARGIDSPRRGAG